MLRYAQHDKRRAQNDEGSDDAQHEGEVLKRGPRPSCLSWDTIAQYITRGGGVTVQSHRRRSITLSVLMLAFMTLLSQANAAQTIKDEAGRTIYTIDDDGNVTMFENSPGIDGGTARVLRPVAVVRNRSVRAATASVCINTEQPGTPFFDLAMTYAARGPVVLDINRFSLDAVASNGRPVVICRWDARRRWTLARRPATRHVDLGFSRSNATAGTFIGWRRGMLWEWKTDLRFFSWHRPIMGGRAGLRVGRAKSRGWPTPGSSSTFIAVTSPTSSGRGLSKRSPTAVLWPARTRLGSSRWSPGCTS